MTCVRLAGGHGFLCVGGDVFRILLDGKVFHFEWHRYSGPVAITRSGNMLSVQPQKFLQAATLWNNQGRHVDAHGWCQFVWVDDLEPGYHVVRRGRLSFIEPITDADVPNIIRYGRRLRPPRESRQNARPEVRPAATGGETNAATAGSPAHTNTRLLR